MTRPGGRRTRAVVFDLDDTLLDHAGAAAEAVLGFAAAQGIDRPDPDLVSGWSRLSDLYYPRYQSRELTLDEHRRARVRAFLDAPGLGDGDADDLFADYQGRYRAAWRAHDDALPVLERCRAAGLGVGVLTNGETAMQTEKLRRTGLLDAVDVVAASSALPAAKPDPRAFTAVAGRLGVAVGDVLVVGDSLENDVAGALGAGADAVFLDRLGLGAPPALAHVRRIAGLDELEP